MRPRLRQIVTAQPSYDFIGRMDRIAATQRAQDTILLRIDYGHHVHIEVFDVVLYQLLQRDVLILDAGIAIRGVVHQVDFLVTPGQFLRHGIQLDSQPVFLFDTLDHGHERHVHGMIEVGDTGIAARRAGGDKHRGRFAGGCMDIHYIGNSVTAPVGRKTRFIPDRQLLHGPVDPHAEGATGAMLPASAASTAPDRLQT